MTHVLIEFFILFLLTNNMDCGPVSKCFNEELTNECPATSVGSELCIRDDLGFLSTQTQCKENTKVVDCRLFFNKRNLNSKCSLSYDSMGPISVNFYDCQLGVHTLTYKCSKDCKIEVDKNQGKISLKSEGENFYVLTINHQKFSGWFKDIVTHSLSDTKNDITVNCGVITKTFSVDFRQHHECSRTLNNYPIPGILVNGFCSNVEIFITGAFFLILFVLMGFLFKTPIALLFMAFTYPLSLIGTKLSVKLFGLCKRCQQPKHPFTKCGVFCVCGMQMATTDELKRHVLSGNCTGTKHSIIAYQLLAYRLVRASITILLIIMLFSFMAPVSGHDVTLMDLCKNNGICELNDIAAGCSKCLIDLEVCESLAYQKVISTEIGMLNDDDNITFKNAFKVIAFTIELIIGCFILIAFHRSYRRYCYEVRLNADHPDSGKLTLFDIKLCDTCNLVHKYRSLCHMCDCGFIYNNDYKSTHQVSILCYRYYFMYKLLLMSKKCFYILMIYILSTFITNLAIVNTLEPAECLDFDTFRSRISNYQICNNDTFIKNNHNGDLYGCYRQHQKDLIYIEDIISKCSSYHQGFVDDGCALIVGDLEKLYVELLRDQNVEIIMKNKKQAGHLLQYLYNNHILARKDMFDPINIFARESLVIDYFNAVKRFDGFRLVSICLAGDLEYLQLTISNFLSKINVASGLNLSSMKTNPMFFSLINCLKGDSRCKGPAEVGATQMNDEMVDKLLAHTKMIEIINSLNDVKKTILDVDYLKTEIKRIDTFVRDEVIKNVGKIEESHQKDIDEITKVVKGFDGQYNKTYANQLLQLEERIQRDLELVKKNSEKVNGINKAEMQDTLNNLKSTVSEQDELLKKLKLEYVGFDAEAITRHSSSMTDLKDFLKTTDFKIAINEQLDSFKNDIIKLNSITDDKHSSDIKNIKENMDNVILNLNDILKISGPVTTTPKPIDKIVCKKPELRFESTSSDWYYKCEKDCIGFSKEKPIKLISDFSILLSNGSTVNYTGFKCPSNLIDPDQIKIKNEKIYKKHWADYMHEYLSNLQTDFEDAGFDEIESLNMPISKDIKLTLNGTYADGEVKNSYMLVDLRLKSFETIKIELSDPNKVVLFDIIISVIYAVPEANYIHIYDTAPTETFYSRVEEKCLGSCPTIQDLPGYLKLEKSHTSQFGCEEWYCFSFGGGCVFGHCKDILNMKQKMMIYTKPLKNDKITTKICIYFNGKHYCKNIDSEKDLVTKLISVEIEHQDNDYLPGLIALDNSNRVRTGPINNLGEFTKKCGDLQVINQTLIGDGVPDIEVVCETFRAKEVITKRCYNNNFELCNLLQVRDNSSYSVHKTNNTHIQIIEQGLNLGIAKVRLDFGNFKLQQAVSDLRLELSHGFCKGCFKCNLGVICEVYIRSSNDVLCDVAVEPCGLKTRNVLLQTGLMPYKFNVLCDTSVKSINVTVCGKSLQIKPELKLDKNLLTLSLHKGISYTTAHDENYDNWFSELTYQFKRSWNNFTDFIMSPLKVVKYALIGISISLVLFLIVRFAFPIYRAIVTWTTRNHKFYKRYEHTQ